MKAIKILELPIVRNNISSVGLGGTNSLGDVLYIRATFALSNI